MNFSAFSSTASWETLLKKYAHAKIMLVTFAYEKSTDFYKMQCVKTLHNENTEKIILLVLL